MKQCKLCGSPLGKEPTSEELDKHWKKHHSWHWESNKEKTPEEALLKNKSKFLKIGTIHFLVLKVNSIQIRHLFSQTRINHTIIFYTSKIVFL